MSVRRQGAGPTVHVVYRFTASPGGKPRPEYFSKELALESFLRALAPVRDEVEVMFLVDGELPADVGTLMRTAGEVRVGEWSSNRASYREQLRVANRVSADLVWFAEDDYLYMPEALAALVAAVHGLPDVEWFALSGPTPLHRLELRDAQSSVSLPHSRKWGAGASWSDGEGRRWERIGSTTSTFGGRSAAIRKANWVLRLCPWSGAAWDRTTCLVVQGATPYPWRFALADLVPPSTPRRGRVPRVGWRIAARVAVNLAAATQRRRGAVLVAPVTPLVGHMDLPYESEPHKWDRLARELDRDDPMPDSARPPA